MLYSFILEYKGGTYCKQVEAGSVNEALEEWCTSLGSEEDFDENMKAQVVSEMELCKKEGDSAIVPLEGVVNMWCGTFLINEVPGLLNIVKTVTEIEIMEGGIKHPTKKEQNRTYDRIFGKENGKRRQT